MIKNGPISIAVDASDFQFYGGGVFTKNQCPNSKVNHAVVIVGYGTENGIPFWKVRNSWGANWGEKGYLRMERGTGTCGLVLNYSAFYIAS